jgi:hypothetical protein
MTPTAVHFAVVLCMSAVALAPGLPTSATAAIFGLIVLVGLANAVRACVGIATYRPAAGPPHWSRMSGCMASFRRRSISVSAQPPLPLGRARNGRPAAWLLVGIRNAWDLVTWIAPMRKVDTT